MKTKFALFLVTLIMAGTDGGLAQTGNAVLVTLDNFIRAETDRSFAIAARNAGGIGKLGHLREFVSVDRRTIIRPNRDTLYSLGVFDLDAAPVTITMPDAGNRYISMQAINHDHYVVDDVLYGSGQRTIAKENAGTRYVLLLARILIDPNDPNDKRQAHAIQDAIKISQDRSGRIETPNWDQASQKKVRDALLKLNETLPDSSRTFGARNAVDPMRHLVGTASAWGGLPEKDAFYLGVTPSKNDGSTVHRLTVKNVPADAFWSITVYDSEGYFQPNVYGTYSVNNITAAKGGDGSISVQFGGCDGNLPNCLPIMQGWNYTVRLYRPRREIIDGSWKFPEAQPLN